MGKSLKRPSSAWRLWLCRVQWLPGGPFSHLALQRQALPSQKGLAPKLPVGSAQQLTGAEPQLGEPRSEGHQRLVGGAGQRGLWGQFASLPALPQLGAP